MEGVDVPEISRKSREELMEGVDVPEISRKSRRVLEEHPSNCMSICSSVEPAGVAEAPSGSCSTRCTSTSFKVSPSDAEADAEQRLPSAAKGGQKNFALLNRALRKKPAGKRIVHSTAGPSSGPASETPADDEAEDSLLEPEAVAEPGEADDGLLEPEAVAELGEAADGPIEPAGVAEADADYAFLEPALPPPSPESDWDDNSCAGTNNVSFDMGNDNIVVKYLTQGSRCAIMSFTRQTDRRGKRRQFFQVSCGRQGQLRARYIAYTLAKKLNNGEITIGDLLQTREAMFSEQDELYAAQAAMRF